MIGILWSLRYEYETGDMRQEIDRRMKTIPGHWRLSRIDRAVNSLPATTSIFSTYIISISPPASTQN